MLYFEVPIMPDSEQCGFAEKIEVLSENVRIHYFVPLVHIPTPEHGSALVKKTLSDRNKKLSGTKIWPNNMYRDFKISKIL